MIPKRILRKEPKAVMEYIRESIDALPYPPFFIATSWFDNHEFMHQYEENPARLHRLVAQIIRKFGYRSYSCMVEEDGKRKCIRLWADPNKIIYKPELWDKNEINCSLVDKRTLALATAKTHRVSMSFHERMSRAQLGKWLKYEKNQMALHDPSKPYLLSFQKKELTEWFNFHHKLTSFLY